MDSSGEKNQLQQEINLFAFESSSVIFPFFFSGITLIKLTTLACLVMMMSKL
jgi:hypothetical protein